MKVVLRRMAFGPVFFQWINLIYFTPLTVCLNGYKLSSTRIGRGVRHVKVLIKYLRKLCGILAPG